MTNVNGAKLHQIAHFGVTITKAALPKDQLTEVQFMRVVLNNLVDQLGLALVAPAVDKDGNLRSPDHVPEIHKLLLDDRVLAVSLVISEVRP